MRVMMPKRFEVLLLATAFSSLYGCDGGGPEMYTVTGTVNFENRPVPKGMITFIPDDPAQRTAAERIVDGQYSLRTTAGKKRVEIMATRDNGPVNPVMGQAPQLQYIPEKFNVESELHAEVTADGENRYDFDLQP